MTTFLEREIAEQPEVLRRLLSEEWGAAQTVAAAIRRFQPALVYIAARGTSDNAARYGQYLIGIQTRLPVALATPSIHTLYESPPVLARALVIGISQSGQAEDVAQVVRDARQQGALTLTITNAPDSPLAQTGEYHIGLQAGQEISVAATKTYTAQLTAVAMLVAAMLQDATIDQALRALPEQVAETLHRCEPISGWAQRYRYMTQFVTVGRGYNYCTAFEITLKLQELCYIIGHGYSEADFLHGPIALVQPGFPVIVVAPSGRTLPSMRSFLTRVQERQAEILVISDDESLCAAGYLAMPIPASTPEWLTPVTAVIPGQVMAAHLAMAKGHAVDQPRGLSKVTVTR